MIFLTLYIIGVILAFLIIGNHNNSLSIKQKIYKFSLIISIFSWIIIIFLVLDLVIKMYEPSLKPIKNLYKRIFKQ